MADPNIKIKRSSVEGKIPTADQLPLGEVALNTYDGKLFASKNVGIGTTVFVVNPWTVGTGTNTYNTYFTAGNAGIGSTNPTSKLSVVGDVNVTGVVTANSFSGSGSALTGIVTYITAGSGISINQNTGNVTITATGGGGGGTGVTIQDEGSVVGVADSITTLNFVGANVSATASGSISTITVADNLVGTALSISGISTFTNGPVLVGSSSSTGTTTQRLQVTGGAYVSSNTGIGTTNPQSALDVRGAITVGVGTVGINSIFSTTDIQSWYYTGKSIPSGNTAPNAVYVGAAGTTMFVVGNNGDVITQYPLSTPYDVSTAGAATTFFSTATQETAPVGIDFRPDGTKMFVVGQTAGTQPGLILNEEYVHEYSLSTPWNVSPSSVGYTTSYLVGSVASQPTGVVIGAAGTAMFISDNFVNDIFQYTLTTPYSLASGVTYASKALDLAQVAETSPQDISLNSTGTSLWVTGTANDRIYEFRLSTPWDISTAVFYDDVYVGFNETTPLGLQVIPEQNVAYIVGSDSTNDNIFQYSTNTPAIEIASSGISSVSSIVLNNETRVKDDLYVKGDTHIEGNIVTQGTLTVDGASTLTGAVTASGSLSVSGTLTAAATVNASTTTSAINLGNSQTTGTFIVGGTSGTGTITLGRSTSTQITNIQAGASGVGTTKTINLGTGGLANSNTAINIGPTAGVGTVVINSGTNLLVGTTTATGTANQKLQVTGGAYVSGSVGIGTTNPTSKLDVVGDAKVSGVVTATTFFGALTGTATTASSVTANSVGLGTDTYGDYVKDITGTANQITVTSGTGEGSSPTLSIPSQFTAPQDVTVTRDLQVNRNLNVNGNITIGGTSATLFSQELKIFDPDIVLGFRTDGSGNDVSTDNTANHGGIAIASTEGTPLIQLYDVGVGETNPSTYKKFMWFKSGTFSGLGTDAWLSNYAIGIGSTQVPNGVRFAAGGMQVTDSTLSVPQLNISGVSTFTGNVSFGTSAFFGDNDSLYFGDGNDLRIYHDGSNSIIQDFGTGSLALQSNGGSGTGIILQKVAGNTENLARFIVDGAVELYYDNTKEFETTGYGATVFGTLQSQGLFSSGVSTISVNSSTDALRITQLGSGNALVVEDETNPDSSPFVVNASGSVGIGTTSSSDSLTVLGRVQIQQDSSSNSRLVFRGQPESLYRWSIDNNGASNDFRIFREDDVTTANGVVYLGISTTGTVSATRFSGDGSLLTGITAAGSGVVVQNQGSPVGTAGTLNFSTNLTASFSSGTATISLSNNPSITGILTADQVYTSNNGNGTNIRIGDDFWVGDINVANTTRFSGAQDSTKAFVVFGTSDAVALGRTGTGPLYYGGDFAVSGVVTASSFSGNASSATYATSAGVSTDVIGGLGSLTQLQVTGVSTFTNGPILVGTATSTGTANQDLQVVGGAYVSDNLGIGITNPRGNLDVVGLTTTTDLYVAGVGTFLSSGLKIRNPANTFQYNITGGAIVADRILNLPVITTTDTLAALNVSSTWTSNQTFSGTLSATSTVSLSGSATGAHNFGTNQTSATLTFGGTSGTGTITFGRATTSQTTNIQAGATASGNQKTINLGTGGASGSFTNINIGPTAGVGTVSINAETNLGIGSATPTSKLDVVGDAKVSGVVTATSFSGNASSATYATTAGVATALQNSRTFEITGDIIASPISFNGTGNVSLAATIQPNSVALGSDTTGDYVQSITGTSNQITVTGGTGEGSTPTLSIPSQFTAPQDVTVTRDLQVNRDLNVSGNITIGGTAATLFSQELKIFDPDIVLGFRTDANNNDVSTDNTANHGGIAIASTEGTPLIQLYDVGIGETNPATYKKIMWFKSGTFTGLGTDAWISNYAISIGSTQVPNGVRLAAGGMQVTDNTISSPQLNISGVTTSTGGFVGNLTGTATTASIATVAQGLTGTPNITVGVTTATSFVRSGGTSSEFLKADGSVDSSTYLTTSGSGTNLTGIVTSIVAGTNITISGSTGQVTINATGGGGGGATAAPLDILEVMLFA